MVGKTACVYIQGGLVRLMLTRGAMIASSNVNTGLCKRDCHYVVGVGLLTC